MTEQGNGSNVGLCSEITKDQARAIFGMADRFLDAERDRGLQLTKKSLERSADDNVSPDDRDAMQQQHLISYVVFRCIREGNADMLELENIQNNVDITHLDDILLKENCEGYAMHFDPGEEENDVKTAMSENPNVVFLRTILDWSRQDGNVWSQQIAWTGSFQESQRLVNLFDIGRNNNTPSCIRFRIQHFDIHSELRNLFVSVHDSNPLAATFSVIDSSPTIDVSEEHVGMDGELTCGICMEKLPIGEIAKQMPCTHIFHQLCVIQWFYRRLSCPVCRRDFRIPT